MRKRRAESHEKKGGKPQEEVKKNRGQSMWRIVEWGENVEN